MALHGHQRRRQRMTKFTAKVGRAKIFLVRMHAVPKTNQRDDVFAELATTLRWIHRSIALTDMSQANILY